MNVAWVVNVSVFQAIDTRNSRSDVFSFGNITAENVSQTKRVAIPFIARNRTEIVLLLLLQTSMFEFNGTAFSGRREDLSLFRSLG